MPIIGEMLIIILLFGFAIPVGLYLKGKYFFNMSNKGLKIQLVIYYIIISIIALIKNCSCFNDINVR